MKDVPLQPAIQCTVAVGPGVPGHGVAGQCRRSCGRCTKSWPPRHQLWDSWCLGPEELCSVLAPACCTKKGRQRTWPLRPFRSTFGLPPATTPKLKS